MQVMKIHLQQVSIKKICIILYKWKVPGRPWVQEQLHPAAQMMVKGICPSPSLSSAFQSFKKHLLKEFPGGPVVRALHFHCRGRGFNLWSGN